MGITQLTEFHESLAKLVNPWPITMGREPTFDQPLAHYNGD